MTELFRVLTVTQGQWGERIASNLTRYCPSYWRVSRWAAPRALPPVIDDPADFLPVAVSEADLVISLGETPSVIQLIPELAQAAKAKAVLAPIDRNESLPPGLIAQLRGWLNDLKISSAFPKPFCSLTETQYNLPPVAVTYDIPAVREFARHFGKPTFAIQLTEDQTILSATVTHDSTCGCARHVADGLAGCPVSNAEHQAGMLHHHFPCLASMTQDHDYQDTLMHVSGNILREAVKVQIQDHLDPVPYFRPQGRVEE